MRREKTRRKRKKHKFHLNVNEGHIEEKQNNSFFILKNTFLENENNYAF